MQVLRELNFGRRVAEEEVDELAAYFVETDQWRQVIGGEVDVIFGPKGAGKSAIYGTLLAREEALFGGKVLLLSAENPRGTPAFKDLVNDPPTTEQEFLSLWKLYILSLLASEFSDYGFIGSAASAVQTALAAEGLLPAKNVPLRGRLKLVLDWVRKSLARGSSLEGSLSLDPSTGTPSVTAKITLAEPSPIQRNAGALSVDSLISYAAQALQDNELTVWLLFDRLDIAFSESRELEANGLRALFKCYLDLLDLKEVRLKIFLRTDIWKSITLAGFREASHITRQITISWPNSSLLNLVVRRLVKNESLVQYLNVEEQTVLQDVDVQRATFDRLVPDQIDVGNNPRTFEWILGRVQDGSGNAAPREVIHLLTEARNIQLQMGERGEGLPGDERLFDRQAFRQALGPVSTVRLEQTLYAEYPELRAQVSGLESEKTEHTIGTLCAIWGSSPEETRSVAQRLVDIGFFEQRGTKAEPRFWVPFLYRPGLSMVQGSATLAAVDANTPIRASVRMDGLPVAGRTSRLAGPTAVEPGCEFHG